MEVLLISGAPSTGKTTVLLEVYKYLQGLQFTANSLVPSGYQYRDKIVLFTGTNKSGQQKTILLNTAADYCNSIRSVCNYIIKNKNSI